MHPKDAFSLLSYLNRNNMVCPLIKGPLFDAQPTGYKTTGTDLHPNPKTKRYEVKGERKLNIHYNSEDEMLFRAWASTNGRGNYSRFISILTGYTGFHYLVIILNYFFHYQLRYMYWRYFLLEFRRTDKMICRNATGNEK